MGELDQVAKSAAKQKQKIKRAKSSDNTAASKRAARPSRPGTFTPEKRQRFLTLYAAGGTVRMHAETVEVSSVTIFNTVRNDPEFAKAYKLAQEANVDHLEDDLHRHAVGGNVTALFGMLRARRPSVWRENLNVKVDAPDFTAAFALAMQGAIGASQSAATAASGPRTDVH